MSHLQGLLIGLTIYKLLPVIGTSKIAFWLSDESTQFVLLISVRTERRCKWTSARTYHSDPLGRMILRWALHCFLLDSLNCDLGSRATNLKHYQVNIGHCWVSRNRQPSSSLITSRVAYFKKAPSNSLPPTSRIPSDFKVSSLSEANAEMLFI